MKRKKMLRGEKNNIQMYREAFYSIINQDMLVELPKEKQKDTFIRLYKYGMERPLYVGQRPEEELNCAHWIY